MLKYQKKEVCKALPLLLVLVMLLTASTGTIQANGPEDGQPTVTDSQGELPLGVSEMMDSSIQLEEPALPKDTSPLGNGLFEADTIPPEFAVGYPKQHEDPLHPGCKRVKMIVAPLEGEVKAYYIAIEHNATPQVIVKLKQET